MFLSLLKRAHRPQAKDWVALGWTDDHWCFGWQDPVSNERQYCHCPMASLAWIGQPHIDLGPWTEPIGQCLRQHIPQAKGLLMALPASVVWHDWVWSGPDHDLSDPKQLLALMPEHWAEEGIGVTGATADRRAFDCKRQTTALGMESQDLDPQTRYWWVSAEAWVVKVHQRLAKEAGCCLVHLDVRAAVLAKALQAQASLEQPVLMLDAHHGHTQWAVVASESVELLGSFSHQRLTPAEHLDHLLTQIQAPITNHHIDTLWLTGLKFGFEGRLASVFGLSIQTLAGDHNTPADRVLVDALLDQQLSEGPWVSI